MWFKKSPVSHKLTIGLFTLVLLGLFFVVGIPQVQAEDVLATSTVAVDTSAVTDSAPVPEVVVTTVEPVVVSTVEATTTVATSTAEVASSTSVALNVTPEPEPIITASAVLSSSVVVVSVASDVVLGAPVSLLSISDEFGGASGAAGPAVPSGAGAGLPAPLASVVVGTLAISDEQGGATLAAGESSFTTGATSEGSFTTGATGEGSFTTTAVGESSFTTLSGGGGGCTSNCGGGGGGCSGNCGGSGGGPIPPPPPPPPSCPLYLFEFIRLGRANNPVEVRKLQAFLNVFQHERLAITGFYSQADFDAVSRFQRQYFADVLGPWDINESTGYVFITTRLAINNVYCNRSTANDLDLSRYYPQIYDVTVTTPGITGTVTWVAAEATSTATSTAARGNIFQLAALGVLKFFNLNPGRTLIVLLVIAILFTLLLIWRLSRYPDSEPEGFALNEVTSADDEVIIDEADSLPVEDDDPAQPSLTT